MLGSMHARTLLLFTIAFVFSSIELTAQNSVIWEDDFGESPDGALFGNGWVAFGRDCDDADFFSTPGASQFGVFGGSFLIEDIEGSCFNGGPGGDGQNTLIVGPISIADLECAAFSVDVEAQGGTLDQDPAAANVVTRDPAILSGTHDQLTIEYSVDNGPPIMLGFFSGSEFNGVATARGIRGDSIKITITMSNNADQEIYRINAIKIQSDFNRYTIPPMVPVCFGEIIDLPTDFEGITGSWEGDGIIGNNQFGADTMGNNFLRFVPDSGQCANFEEAVIRVTEKPVLRDTTINLCDPGGGSVSYDLTSLEDLLGLPITNWGDNLGNPIADPTNFEVTGSATVFATGREAGSCPSDPTPINLIIGGTPTIISPTDTAGCGSFRLPASIVNGGTGEYWTGPDRSGIRLFPGEVIDSTRRIFIVAGNGTCQVEDSFLVEIIPQPDIALPTGELFACDSFRLPEIEGNNLSAPAYYTDTNGNGTRFNPGDRVFDLGQTLLFIYDENGVCNDQDSVLLELGRRPLIDSIPDTTLCGTFTFPLIQSTALTNRSYWTNPGGTGISFAEGDTITRPPGQGFTFFARAGEGFCAAEQRFNITFLEKPEFFPIPDIQACDSFRLFEIKGIGLSGNEAFFTGPDGTGTRLDSGVLINNSTTLFVYDSRGSECIARDTFSVEIGNSPDITPISDPVACDSFMLPLISGLDLTGQEAFFNQPQGKGDVFTEGTVFYTDTTLYIYSNRDFCSTEDTIQIQVIPKPIITFPTATIPACDSFLLPPISGDHLYDPAYFTQPDAQGISFEEGQLLRDSITIYVNDGVPGCSEEIAFLVNIQKTPSIQPLPDTMSCGSFQLPSIQGENLSGAEAYYSLPFGKGARFLPGQSITQSGMIYSYDSTAAGCFAQDSFMVTIQPFSATINLVDSIYCSGETAGLQLDIVGGQAPYTINWNDDSMDGLLQVSGLGAGFYSVEVADIGGCMAQAQIQVIEPEPLDVNCSKVNDISLPLGSDGRMAVEVVGGTGPYQVVVSGPQSDRFDNVAVGRIIIEGLSAGDYTLEVIDQNGCRQICTQSFIAPPCELQITAGFNNVTCGGGSNGRVAVNVANAIGTPQFDWNMDQYDGLGDLVNIPAGLYAVLVTDSVGCQDQIEVTVTQPIPVLLEAEALKQASGPGVPDGSAITRFGGGSAPYQIAINGSNLDTSFQLLQADSLTWSALTNGNYSITSTDANGCTKNVTLAITEPTCGMQLQLTSQQPTCPGDSTGNMALEIMGGTGPYQIRWSTGDTSMIATGLSSGHYSATVTDIAGCIHSVTDTLSPVFEKPLLGLAFPTILCADQCQNIPVNLQGVAPYQLQIQFEADGFSQPQGINLTTDSSTYSLCADIFPAGVSQGRIQLLSVSDANCSTPLDTTFTIDLLPRDTNFVRDTLCIDDQISLGGTSFSSENASDTLVLSGAATNGCDSVIVVDLHFIEFVEDSLQQTLCPGDSIVISGITYDQNNPSGTALFPGASAIGCDSLLYINLQFFSVSDTLRPVLCPGDSLVVNGVRYDRQNPFGSETFPAAGSSGCDSVVVIDLQFNAIDTSFIIQELCPGDSLVVNGTIYDSTRLSGIERLPGAAVSGCDSVIQVEIRYLPPAIGQFAPQLCPGESVEINGTVYNADRPDGTEVLIGQARNGCDSIVQISLQYLPENRVILNREICPSEHILVNGVRYDETHPTGVELFPNGSSSGCDSIVEIDLQILEATRGSISGDSSICAGESTTLRFNLIGADFYDIQYQIDSGIIVADLIPNGHSIIVNPQTTTTYRIISLNASTTSCPGIPGPRLTVQVSKLQAGIQDQNDFGGFGISCSGKADGAVHVQEQLGIPPYQYQWNNGSTAPNLERLGPGTYAVTVTDAASCTDTASIQLFSPEPIQFELSSAPSTCPDLPNGSIQITNLSGGAGGYEYSLDGEFFRPADGTSFSLTNQMPGDYSVQIQDINDCRTEQSIQIAEGNLELDLGPDRDLKIGDSLQLEVQANFDIVSYNWVSGSPLSTPNSLSPTVSPEQTAAFTLFATDATGCTVSDIINVRVDQSRKTFQPTAFTPNEDGNNDRFTIFGDTDIDLIEQLTVFDRWGNVLFDARDIPPNNEQYGWDGTYKGQLQAGGVYIYQAVIRFTNGDRQNVQGDVSLFR